MGADQKVIDELLQELQRAKEQLVAATSFASAISISSKVDTTEWDLHRGMAQLYRDRFYNAALRIESTLHKHKKARG